MNDIERRTQFKKALDAAKIRSFETGPHKHGYVYEEWRPWTGNNYIKSYYDVKLLDGTIIEHCWPNAGNMLKGYQKFDAMSNVQVRLSEHSPF